MFFCEAIEKQSPTETQISTESVELFSNAIKKEEKHGISSILEFCTYKTDCLLQYS